MRSHGPLLDRGEGSKRDEIARARSQECLAMPYGIEKRIILGFAPRTHQCL